MSNNLWLTAVNKGLAAARPTTPDIPQNTIAFYFATDTGVMSVFTGTVWSSIAGATGAVTLVTNAGTLSAPTGKITTEALTTAAGASQALTITNAAVVPTDIILVTRNGGTDTTNSQTINAVAGTGSYVITLTNPGAAAFNGTFILGVTILKAS